MPVRVIRRQPVKQPVSEQLSKTNRDVSESQVYALNPLHKQFQGTNTVTINMILMCGSSTLASVDYTVLQLC